MKYIFRVFTIFITIIILFSNIVFSSDKNKIGLTEEEWQWLESNKYRTFTLGIDPYSGIEHFEYEGKEKGYLINFIKVLNQDLGLNVKLEATKTWGEVYSGLQEGNIDILLGANETPERTKFMSFTRPINKNAYAIISKINSTIHTVGDLDKKTVGFMKNDIVINLLPEIYKNINYYQKYYPSQEEGIAALSNGEIDAYVMPGGPIVYDYIYRYPDLNYAFKLSNLTSDMTLSAMKKDKILISILDKEIQLLQKSKLPQMIKQSEKEYNIKIMNLTQSERDWLRKDGKAVVGITKDYLPFDYYENGIYKGISGQIIAEISRKTGIEFIYDYDDFDALNQKLVKGQVDILNIAKTEDRMKDILYPRPYSTERDIIIGKKDSMHVRDIFGLEGKRVAVIKGFWHYEHLVKNLTKVDIVETNNIQESLKLVNDGKADYLIENPTVARYYIEELQLHDLVERGITSTDSYLYYGITKYKPELASIIDKVIPLMDINELSRIGYEEVPHSTNYQYFKKLILTIIGLGILLIIVVIYVIKLINDLIKERTQSELLRQREHFLSIDTLTNVYNRNYFNTKIKNILDLQKHPLSIIVADMNNLKLVNDTYGHHAGDELLKHFSDILKEAAADNGQVFRIGGDEFYIILEKDGAKQAESIINKIRDAISRKVVLIDEKHRVTADAAFGYAIRYSDEMSFDELIRMADKNMYLDKYRERMP